MQGSEQTLRRYPPPHSSPGDPKVGTGDPKSTSKPRVQQTTLHRVTDNLFKKVLVEMA